MRRQIFAALLLLTASTASTASASAQSPGASPSVGSQTLQGIERAVETLNKVSDRAVRARVDSQRRIGETDKAIARETDPAARKALQDIRDRAQTVRNVADEQLELVRGARQVADGPVGERFDQAFQKLGQLDAYLKTIEGVAPGSTRRDLQSTLNQHLYNARLQAGDATSQLMLRFVIDFSSGLARFAAELSGAEVAYRMATGRTMDGDEASRLDAAVDILEMYIFGKVVGKIARGENPLHGELVVPGTGRGATPAGRVPVSGPGAGGGTPGPTPATRAPAPPARTATGSGAGAATGAGGTTTLEPPPTAATNPTAGGTTVVQPPPTRATNPTPGGTTVIQPGSTTTTPARPTTPGGTTVFEPPPTGTSAPKPGGAPPATAPTDSITSPTGSTAPPAGATTTFQPPPTRATNPTAGGTTVFEPPAGGATATGRPPTAGGTTVFEPPPTKSTNTQPGGTTILEPGAGRTATAKPAGGSTVIEPGTGGTNPGGTTAGGRTAVETPGSTTAVEGARSATGVPTGNAAKVEYARIYEGNFRASQQQQLAAATREGVPNMEALRGMSPQDILRARMRHAGLEMSVGEANRMLELSTRAHTGQLSATDIAWLKEQSAMWRRHNPTGPDYLDSLGLRGPVTPDGFAPVLTPDAIRGLRERSGIGSETIKDIINRVRSGVRPTAAGPAVRPPIPPPDSAKPTDKKDDKVPPPAPPVAPAPSGPPAGGGTRSGTAALPAGPAAPGSSAVAVTGQVPSTGVPPLEFTMSPGSGVIDETVTRAVTMPKELDLLNYMGDLTFGGGRNPAVQVMMIDAVDLRVPALASVGRDLPAPSSTFGLRSLWNLLRGPARRGAALSNRSWTTAATPFAASPRAQRNANREAAAPVKIFLESLGSSTGEAFDIRVVNGGNETLQLSGDGLVVEPLDAKGQSGARREMQNPSLRSAAAARLNAYCLEFLRQPPSPGMLFKIASQDLQQKFAPTRKILQAARRLQETGLLKPDSNPLDYFHSIKQWALWTKEQDFDLTSFRKAFVEHAKKNLKAAGRDWTRQIEDAVLGVVPGRWQDIVKVLQAADPAEHALFQRASGTPRS